MDLQGLLLLLLIVVAGLLFLGRFASSWVVRTTLRLVRVTLGFRRRSLSASGSEWPYLEKCRRPNQPVFLLVHGYAADKDSWLSYAALLAKGYNVVMPDLPGFGESSIDPDGDYSPRLQAKRLADFCEAYGAERYHVVGTSMGGFISAWLAIDSPHHAATLTLMNAAGVFGRDASVVQREAEQGTNPLLADSDETLARLLSLLAHRPLFVPGLVRRHMLREYQSRGAHLQRVFQQLITAQEQDVLVGALSSICCPTLVVWGEHDQIIDVSCADVFEAEIPDAEKLVLPNVGHIPMFEATKATALAQIAFVRTEASTKA
ncbi:MAG: alpha/beta fold hydrolase [Woeseiaceae bacterium]